MAGASRERLFRTKCLDLLAALSTCRLVSTRQALPAPEPVNFAVTNGETVVRAVAARKLAGMARGDVVALNADDLDTEVKVRLERDGRRRK